jgi:uncharacterized iron-regulated membrane protein
MQGEALWSAYHPEATPTTQPLLAGAVPEWMNTVLAMAQRTEGEGTIAAIYLRMDNSEPRAQIFWTAPDRVPLLIDPRAGSVVHPSADESGRSPFRKLTRLMLELHRGDLLGLPGRLLGLLCGIALLTLALTGLMMYLKIYRQRIKLRRWVPFW